MPANFSPLHSSSACPAGFQLPATNDDSAIFHQQPGHTDLQQYANTDVQQRVSRKRRSLDIDARDSHAQTLVHRPALTKAEHELQHLSSTTEASESPDGAHAAPTQQEAISLASGCPYAAAMAQQQQAALLLAPDSSESRMSSCLFLAQMQQQGLPSHTAPSAQQDDPSDETQTEGHKAGTSPPCNTPTSSPEAPSTPSPTHSQPTSQLWNLKRPQLSHCPKLTRRQLRAANRSFSLQEVAQHKFVDDCWIAVDGSVYDITEHVAHHPSWEHGGISTIISILAHAGSECSEEFHEIHRPYPIAFRQLKAFYIGELADTGGC